MDKKNIIIGILVAAVVVCGYFALQNRKGVSPQRASLESEPVLETNVNQFLAETKEPKNNVSINELVAAGRPVMCAVSLAEGSIGLKQDLTIFVASGRVRSISKTTAPGKNFSPNMIIMDGYQYVWPVLDSDNQGEKINIAAIAKESPEVSAFMKGFGMDEKMDLDCAPWTIDEQKFSLPKAVVFEDVTDKARESLQIVVSGGNSVPAPVTHE